MELPKVLQETAPGLKKTTFFWGENFPPPHTPKNPFVRKIINVETNIHGKVLVKHVRYAPWNWNIDLHFKMNSRHSSRYFFFLSHEDLPFKGVKFQTLNGANFWRVFLGLIFSDPTGGFRLAV